MGQPETHRRDSPEPTRPWLTAGGRLELLGQFAVATLALSVLFYFASAHAYAPNSDSATVLLEGAVIQHGQIALRGWSLSLDSFWTIDALFYALGVAVDGIRASSMHLVPAVLAAITVVIGVHIATDGAKGRGRIVAGAVMLIALGLPAHAMSYFLLQGPWHVATALYCLVAMAVLRHNRFGWAWAGAVLLLAGGLDGDIQALAIGVIPVFVAGVIAALRTRTIRAGLALASAAAASILLAVLLRLLALAIGTFRVSESHHTVRLHQLGPNLEHVFSWSSALFGLGQGVFGGPHVPWPLEAPRALLLVAVAAAAVAAAFGLVRDAVRGAGPSSPEDQREIESWRLDDLLVLGFVGSIGVFLVLTLSNNHQYARYLDPVVIFGSILAARAGARLATRLTRPMLFGAVAVGAVVLGTSSAALGIDLAAEAPPIPTASLEQFLAGHHLDHGIGDYWAASIVTVDTKGAIVIRPVVANLSSEIVPDGREASSAWYQGQHFQFLVYDRVPYGRVTPPNILKTFGPPAHTYQVGRYFVDVWSHSLTLSPTPFP